MKMKDVLEGIQQRTRSDEQGRAKYPGKQFFAKGSGFTKAAVLDMIQERMAEAEYYDEWQVYVGHKFDESKVSNDMMQRFADGWQYALEDSVGEHGLEVQEGLILEIANKIADW